MASLSAGQVYALARSGGFNAAEAVIATAVAGAESGWNPAAKGDVGIQTSTWGPSIGLWQVRSIKAQSGTGQPRDATRLTDPGFNARAAYTIYKQQGWGAWSVYTSGKYETYLAAAGGGASSGVTLPSGGTGSSTSGSTLTAGTVENAGLTGAAGDAVADGLESVWSKVQPFLVTGLVASLGLVLLGAGVVVTAWPTSTRVADAGQSFVDDLGSPA